MAKTFSRELMETVVDEMNAVMGLDPAIEATMPDDDTLLGTIVHEATGRGVLKDAIRADDFESTKPGKKLFTRAVLDFFIAAGVWDARKKAVLMPKAGTAAASAPVESAAEPELPLGAEEQTAHDDMEAGETTGDEPSALPAKKPRSTPVDRKKTAAVDKVAQAKTTKQAAPAKTAVAAKEEVMAAKTTKKAAAKTTKKATAKKATAESGPSNKFLVHQAWKNGKGETDIAKLVKHVKGGVTEGTVRGWISAWGKGKNLPGGVKK